MFVSDHLADWLEKFNKHVDECLNKKKLKGDGEHEAKSSKDTTNSKRVTKLEVTLDDNAAKKQYNNAESQKKSAESKLNKLAKEVGTIQRDIDRNFDTMQIRVGEIRSLISGYNFSDLFYPVMKEMQTQAEINGSDVVLEYFNKLKDFVQNLN